MKKYLILVGLALTSCTNNFQASNTINATVLAQLPNIPAVPTVWCSYIPEQYRHYIPDCNVPVTVSKPVVSAEFTSHSNWNDFVKFNDTTSVCDGTETSAVGCLNGGTHKLVTTTETSCDSLSLVDSLGVFNWNCSVVEGHAAFTSDLKTDKGLQNLISGTSFIPMYVTLTKLGVSINSDTSTWWTNNITTLSNNSDPGNASITLSSAGTIYVTSSNIYTSGYNITADRVSVVTLNGSTIFRNARTSTDTTLEGTIGSGYYTVLSTGGHKFLWIEGNYDMNNTDTGGEFTVFLSATKLSTLKLVHSNHGFPIYLYQSHYNKLDNVLATNSSDFGITLDSSNGNFVVNSTANDNLTHYGIGVGNSGGNLVENFKVNNSFGGLRLWSTTSPNTFNNMLITNVESGIYVVDNTVENYISNVTVTNVSDNSGLFFDRSDSQHASNILIDTCHYGLTLSVAHTNFVSEMKVVNCDTGIYEYDGYGLDLSNEIWLDNETNCNNSYGDNPGFTIGCAAAGSSTHSLVTSSSNVFGYQL